MPIYLDGDGGGAGDVPRANDDGWTLDPVCRRHGGAAATCPRCGALDRRRALVEAHAAVYAGETGTEVEVWPDGLGFTVHEAGGLWEFCPREGDGSWSARFYATGEVLPGTAGVGTTPQAARAGAMAAWRDSVWRGREVR